MSTPAKLPSSGYEYIASVPGVRSGQAIVEGTRMGVHDVIALLPVNCDQEVSQYCGLVVVAGF